MIQFVLGAALGVAGYKFYKEKKETDPEFKEKMDKIEDKVSSAWSQVVSNAKDTNDSVFKTIVEDLSEAITDAIKEKDYEKEYADKLSAIKEEHKDSPKAAWEMLILYIKTFQEENKQK